MAACAGDAVETTSPASVAKPRAPAVTPAKSVFSQPVFRRRRADDRSFIVSTSRGFARQPVAWSAGSPWRSTWHERGHGESVQPQVPVLPQEAYFIWVHAVRIVPFQRFLTNSLNLRWTVIHPPRPLAAPRNCTHSAVFEVREGLSDLLLRVHHKGSPLNDRLADRFSAENQQIEVP